VRECELPEAAGCSLAARTLAACVAAILEVPVDEVPCTVARDPFAPVTWWLATRSLGLVPVADAESFQWGGWWIARLAGADGRPAEPFAGVVQGLFRAAASAGPMEQLERLELIDGVGVEGIATPPGEGASRPRAGAGKS
jgi:hypothetical protein